MVAKLVRLPMAARAVLLALPSMEAELARLANLAVEVKLVVLASPERLVPVALSFHLLDARERSSLPTRTWSRHCGMPSGCRRATSSSRM